MLHPRPLGRASIKRYQPKIKSAEIAEEPQIAMARTESFSSESESDYEDELLFDDIDGGDAAPTEPSTSWATQIS